MPAVFRTHSVEVSNRLEELGWTAEELLEVAESMVAARFSCTDIRCGARISSAPFGHRQ